MINRLEHFAFSISAISRDLHKIAADTMVKYDLKGPHAFYLLAISKYSEGITATQISDVSGRDKADVSRAVSLLEEKGLVRKANCGVHRYRAPITLTPQGREAADKVRTAARIAVEEAGKGLTEEQRRIFYEVLDIISANLHTISEVGLTSGLD